MKKAELSLLIVLTCMMVNAQIPVLSDFQTIADNMSLSGPLSHSAIAELTFLQQNLLSEEAQPQNTESVKWEKVGPGGGGATFYPTFSYSTPDNYLIRCDMQGSYLTRDGGVSYQQINYPGGASCYAWDPNDPKRVYICGAAVNRSIDGGKTWERIFPIKSDIVREVYSGDHGDYRIEVVPGSLYGRGINNFRVDPARPGTLYFSSGSSLIYSTDEGKTWKREAVAQAISYIYTNKTSLKDEVYLFSSTAIFKFNKTSHTVSQQDLPQEIAGGYSFTGGTKSGSDNVVFYALRHSADPNSRGDEVWKSEDKGITWKQLTDQVVTDAAFGTKPTITILCCSEYQAEYAYAMTTAYSEKKDDNTIRWYGALRTTDAGKSWELVFKGARGQNLPDNLKDAWAFTAFDYTMLMYLGVSPTDGKVAILTDWYASIKTMDAGKTWKEVYSAKQPDGTFKSRGLDVLTCYGVHFDPFDKNHIAISYTDIGFHHSFNGGNTWARSVNGIPREWENTCYWMVFDPTIKGKMWSVWSSMHDLPRGKMTRNARWKEQGRGGVAISLDGGKTWKPSVEGMGTDSPSTCIVMDPKSAPENRTLYVATYNKGVFKSTDDGKTWQLKNNGITDNTCAFELTLTSNGTLFLTVSIVPTFKEGPANYSGAVYRSTDGAETWTKLNVAPVPDLFPNGIDYDRKNPSRIYLACWANAIGNAASGPDDMPGGIFVSDNNGTTWTQIFDKTQYVYDVTVDPYHPGRLYCNTFNTAAYRSDDYGKTWKKILGYDFHWGHRVIVDEINPEKIYITTFGSSVWHGIPVTE